MRLLIVEDSPAYSELMLEVADSIGLEADAVVSGEEAIRKLESSAYDLAIIDLHLPGMDGLELCYRVRNNDGGELIPLILITADPDNSLQEKAFDAGVTEIFHKTEAEPLQHALASFISRIEQNLSGHILYVEDSPSVAELIRSWLSGAGLEVTHFTSADAALDAFKTGNFDLVISDIVVEGQLSGIGLLRTIRSLPDTRSEIPFLAVSGSLDKQRKITILRQGADDLIEKPALREELLARIGNLITRKQLFDQVMEQQKKLQQLAITDSLTGLYNKGYLAEIGQQMLSGAERQRHPLSLIVMDLDYFKQVNDTYGHSSGDHILSSIGKLMKDSCRGEDLAGRFGGEEFVLVLPRCSLSNARDKAEQLRTSIQALNTDNIPVTASFGVTCTVKDQTASFADLFKQADEAMYKAKAEGRNRVAAYSPALDESS